MRFIRDLWTLLKRRDFRRLFAVRLTSQFGDGVFQVALASYVLFSPERAPDAAAIAGLFAVALLPYSVLGPFTGVLLDRWSRRQILFGANLTRAVLVVGVGAIVATGNAGVPFYLAVLLTLGVNRFLLSGLSAGLPHVVERDELVMANAVTPTSGTAFFLIGGGVGAVVKLIGDSDLAVLGLTVVVYTAAALLALRLRRDQLGPDLNGDEPGIVEALRTIASGLIDGARYLGTRKQAALGLGAIGSLRFFFGLMTVSMILLYRNYFYGPDQLDEAFGALAIATGAVGAGLFLAALPIGLYTQPALIVGGFLTGFCAQGVKISVDTLVQTGVDDVYRGRVFALYDMIYNVGQVSAAALGAWILPDDGKSYAVLAFIVLGFAATAVVYSRLSRDDSGTAQGGDGLDGGGLPRGVRARDQADERTQQG